MVTLDINDKPVEVDADPSTPLLWTLRNNLGLTGTKFGCGVTSCGAYMVHLNDQPTRSCALPISAMASQRITASEHIADDRIDKAIFDAQVKHDVTQCGHCQSGRMMNVVGLLRTKKKPTDASIDSTMADSLYRCTAYRRIRATIRNATKSLA